MYTKTSYVNFHLARGASLLILQPIVEALAMELVVAASKHLYLLKSLEVLKTDEALGLAASVAPCSLLNFPNLILCESATDAFAVVLLAHLDGLLQ